MKILIIDNFDSFTYNLVQYLGELGADVAVVRNDTIRPLSELLANVDGLVVSPGPCEPTHAGNSIAALRCVGSADGPHIPALGVCLGHQALAEAFGGRVVRARAPMHGKTSLIWHDGSPLFAGVPCPTEVMRYHSLVVAPDCVPSSLRVTARTSDGTIMALAHQHYPIYGVQFHPESILTDCGKTLLNSFLTIVRSAVAAHPGGAGRSGSAGGSASAGVSPALRRDDAAATLYQPGNEPSHNLNEGTREACSPRAEFMQHPCASGIEAAI